MTEHKRHQYSSSDSIGLIFTRLCRFVFLIMNSNSDSVVSENNNDDDGNEDEEGDEDMVMMLRKI